MEWANVTVPGFEHLYEVSNTGIVRSRDRVRPGGIPGSSYAIKGRVLQPSTSPKGYKQVNLSVDKRHVACKVHHLVLGAFCKEPRDGRQCRHLDGNPANNHINNLAWGTAKENIADCVRHGTRAVLFGAAAGNSKLDDAKVLQIRERLAAGVPQRKIAAEFGVQQHTIKCINRRQTWRHLPDTPMTSNRSS